jgi:hypothetical protein
MGDPTSSYATAGIALRVSGALKPHHHDKVETLGGATKQPRFQILNSCFAKILYYEPFSIWVSRKVGSMIDPDQSGILPLENVWF